jgi:hypothetical protein
LKLSSENLVSKFAVKFNLYRYNEAGIFSLGEHPIGSYGISVDGEDLDEEGAKRAYNEVVRAVEVSGPIEPGGAADFCLALESYDVVRLYTLTSS